MRTLVQKLTSGAGGVNSLGGFIFGLDNFNNDASGYIAVIERNPGNGGYISVYNFENGAMGSDALEKSSNFDYDNSDDKFFLDFSITGDTYTLNAFADGQIDGSGSDISRFTSNDFESEIPIASITGSLVGYNGGYTGVYADTGDSSNTGSVELGMFYLNHKLIPEPGTTTLALACVAGLLVMARRRNIN